MTDMLGILVLAVLGLWAIFYRESITEVSRDLPQKLSDKLDQLWDIAQQSLQERKYLRAEKALLTILRVDERNATAYNRLGILYAKQKAFEDAIECFEIAQSLEPSASSLHNVGLIYFETGNNEKAALAFEQALDMEGNMAARYIAYAKVLEKLGRTKRMIDALEKAVALEPVPQTLNILADAYEQSGQTDLATELRDRSAKMKSQQETPKIARPVRRVVM
jgi:tetratricopeptide (TPR) repeat protein